MAGKLENKVAIVTAGGSGIGAATVRRFAREGAAVVIADLSGSRAEQVRADVTGTGGRAVTIKMDVADPQAIEAMIKLALDSFGRLDVLFNNAGMAEVSLIHETTLESWERVIAVTLTGTFLGLKYAIPIMRRQGGGAVINTASISGMHGDYGMASYNAAKAGVINLTRAAALENAKHRIRVNCVCPGAINTRVAQILGKGRADEFRRVMGAAHPVGRMGEADEIANTVTFLASDEASFITGASFVVDGGVTAGTGLPRLPGAE
jgi:meso-butanediol dehydrogenase / (S,S)-butanediol dehydrogenase / diacetyl reductase